VSEASGVSEMTVSRVLRNRGDVSEATRAKVLEAARRLGYVPNRIAGALASQRVNLVGVVIPSFSNMVFPEVLAGLSGVLEPTELQPVVGVTDYDPAKEEKVIYEMLSWRPSGLVVAGLEHTDAARAMMGAAGIPVVEIMDVDGEPVDAVVGISHTEAGRAMARELVVRGYRRIGFLGTKMPGDHRARKRLDGFVAGLAEAGVSLAAEAFYSGGSALAKGRQMTADILERHPDLDCLYYSNDLIAAGGLLECMSQGIDVPGKIGLAGFNRLDLVMGLPKRIATMNSRRRETGEAAASIILDRLRERPDVPDRVRLEATFEPGETLAPRQD